MNKIWPLCLLMSAMAWGQAAPATPPSTQSPAPAPAAAIKPQPPTPPADPGAALPPDTPVLTITVNAPCPGQPKTAAVKTGAATSVAKTAAAAPKPPAECKTIYTKAEFEKLGNALVKSGNPQAPDISLQQKRQLASTNNLPSLTAMSEAAQAKGLDKTERYKELMKFARMQILARELQRSVQEEAAKVSDAQMETYYKENPEAYEQFNLDRLYIPRFKQVEANKEEAKEEEKLTEEQQKEKQEKEKAERAEGEQELTKLADALRARAAQGEDFVKLQKEAYDASGMKVEAPNVTMAKQRRTMLPATQAAVFDLKAGEVSEVISDAGGHYIFKVDSKEVLPFDQVKNEIHTTLQNQKQRDLMEKLQSSFKAEPNEAYFGGPLTPAPGARPIPPRMPVPRPGAPAPTAPSVPQGAAAPPAQNAPAPPAAAQPPASKPN